MLSLPREVCELIIGPLKPDWPAIQLTSQFFFGIVEQFATRSVLAINCLGDFIRECEAGNYLGIVSFCHNPDNGGRLKLWARAGFEAAALSGCQPLITWLRKQNIESIGNSWARSVNITALLVLMRDPDTIKGLIAGPFDGSPTSEELAVRSGSLDLVKWSVARYYSISTNRDVAVELRDSLIDILELGCRYNQPQIIEWVLNEHQAIIADCVLGCAAAGGNIPLLEATLSTTSPSPEELTCALERACRYGHHSAALILKDSGAGGWSDRMLRKALQGGNTECVKLVLDQGIIVSSNDVYLSTSTTGIFDLLVQRCRSVFSIEVIGACLHHAVAEGNLPVIRKIVKMWPEEMPKLGRGLLPFGCFSSDCRIVEWLVHNFPIINARDYQKCLWEAHFNRDLPAITRLMISKGVQVNSKLISWGTTEQEHQFIDNDADKIAELRTLGGWVD